MGVQIELDKDSLKHLEKQLDFLKKDSDSSISKALAKIGMRLKTTAQLRLKGRGHIVTSRLRNSIFVKGLRPLMSEGYSDNNGKTYNAQLPSVILKKGEVAIGTNVDYAEKIEMMDSYLYWATKNIDIATDLGNELKNFMKFGKGLI